MLDFHCHCLPGVDDGAPDAAAAQALLCEQFAQGVRQLVVTPHWASPRFESVNDPVIETAWAQLQAIAADHCPDMQLFLGAEHHCSGLVRAEDFVAHAKTLGPAKAVLVEFPDDHVPANGWETLFALKRNGLRPIIAHPERCKGIDLAGSELANYIANGGLLQITAGHVAGKHGLAMRWRSRKFLKR